MIDLRSDTVTKPSKAMLEAMWSAEVGDDVFKEDRSINELEELAASLFGKEAGLFCPSGTMTNQIAVNVHTQPGDEMICSDLCHIYNYEGAGVARNSGVQVKLVTNERGMLTEHDVLNRINPPDSHYANTSLVALEDTVNKAGGLVYDFDEIMAISKRCKAEKLKLHLDGARVFNSLVETGVNSEDYGSAFDSISVCLSKGLGSPSGSVLLGNKEFISKAHRVRKSMGGGMRQAGYIAAAGTYALKNNVERLKEDHKRAKSIAGFLRTHPSVTQVVEPETNIILFKVNEKIGSSKFIAAIEKQGLAALPFSKNEVRFVTHLHITDNELDSISRALKNTVV